MSFEILHGNSIKVIQRLKTDQNLLGQVDSVVTSPPYFQKRTYLDKADSNLSFELGREKNPNEFLRNLATVFLEARPLLKDSATLFINLGDTFRDGQALGIPAGFVRVMKQIGYHFIQEIVWAKSITTKEGNRGSCKPESVTRRFTNSHEYVLFFVKDKEEYYFDGKSVSISISAGYNKKIIYKTKPNVPNKKENSRKERFKSEEYLLTGAEIPTKIRDRIIQNKIQNQDFTARRRSVWLIATPNSRNRHTAVGPEELFEICIKAGTPIDGLVFDPFVGEGTTGKAALRNERRFLGIDLDKRSCLEAKNNLEYVFESLAS